MPASSRSDLHQAFAQEFRSLAAALEAVAQVTEQILWHGLQSRCFRQSPHRRASGRARAPLFFDRTHSTTERVMAVDKDRTEGSAEKLGGKAKEAFGNVTGDS